MGIYSKPSNSRGKSNNTPVECTSEKLSSDEREGKRMNYMYLLRHISRNCRNWPNYEGKGQTTPQGVVLIKGLLDGL